MKGKRPGQPRPMPDRDMTVTEAAALLGVTRQAVLQAISRGKLVARRMGKAGYIITLADIDRAYRPTGEGRFMLWPTAPGRAGLLLIDKFSDPIKKANANGKTVKKRATAIDDRHCKTAGKQRGGIDA